MVQQSQVSHPPRILLQWQSRDCTRNGGISNSWRYSAAMRLGYTDGLEKSLSELLVMRPSELLVMGPVGG